MTESFADAYPEAAPYIEQAVAEHGEAWVLEHYYEQLYPLGRVIEMPKKEELPFFEADDHETMSADDLVEMYTAWADYRENLRTGTTSKE